MWCGPGRLGWFHYVLKRLSETEKQSAGLAVVLCVLRMSDTGSSVLPYREAEERSESVEGTSRVRKQ